MKLEAKKIKKYVGNHKLKEAIESLEEIKDLSVDSEKSLLLIKQKFSKLKKNRINGTNTETDQGVEEAEISNRIIDLLNNLVKLDEQKKLIDPLWSSILKNEIENIRETLLNKYNNRLRQKTDFGLPIDLSLTFTEKGTSEERKSKLWGGSINTTKKIENGLVATLLEHEHLLIIGDPGAGKTTQLLTLATNWLANKAGKEIPVIFNLAHWTSENEDFAGWLQSILVSTYGFSNALAKEAIDKKIILPLFDGLDEVGKHKEDKSQQEEVRNQCLKAIITYNGDFDPTYLVICSRKNEYIAILDAPVRRVVLINPLTIDAIKEKLGNVEKQPQQGKKKISAGNILYALDQNSALQEVICTPFYYDIALEVFDEDKEYNLPNDSKVLEQYLVEEFVRKKLRRQERKLAKQKYDSQSMMYYLSWLASFLTVRNRMTFELIDFQPRDLDGKWRINLLRFWPFGLFLSYLGWWFLEWKGLTIGVVLFGLFVVKHKEEYGIKPIEKKRWKWSELLKISIWFKSLFKAVFVVALLWRWFIPLTLIFQLYLHDILALDLDVENLKTRGSKCINEKPPLLYYVGFLLFFLHSYIVENDSFLAISTPYQRFKREIGITQKWVFFFIVVLAWSFIFDTEDWAWKSGLVIPVFIFYLYMIIHISPLFEHYTLRLGLFWEKKMPLDWIHFFNNAVDARILESDGGQWRFRHLILQDYFAGLYEKKDKQ